MIEFPVVISLGKRFLQRQSSSWLTVKLVPLVSLENPDCMNCVLKYVSVTVYNHFNDVYDSTTWFLVMELTLLLH